MVATFLLTQWYRQPYAGSPILVYLVMIADQILFIWLVAVGVHARGGTLSNLIGKVWRSPFDGVRDLFLAVFLLILAFAASAAFVHLLGARSDNTTSLVSLLL